MPNIDPFEKFSDRYDNWFERNLNLYQDELEAIRQAIPCAEAKGLEIGVGTGKFAQPLGIKVGVEPSRKMAEKAEQLGIKVYPNPAENLPFSDGEFDYALMVTTICFVDDIIKSFSEAYRVLKSGGYLIIGFVDRESELGKRYFEKRNSNEFYKDATFYSSEEVLDLLKRVGFQITMIKQTLIPDTPSGTILDGFGKGAFIVIQSKKVI